MKEQHNDLDKEILDGLDKAERMLKRQRVGISVGVAMGIVILAIIGAFSYSRYQEVSAEQTATSVQLRIEQTTTQRPIETSTARAAQTATKAQVIIQQTVTQQASIDATKTVKAEERADYLTQRAEPTITARAKIDDELSNIQDYIRQYTGSLTDAEFSFHDANGELIHKDDDYIKTRCTASHYKNFIVVADFQNPYNANYHRWSYGFLFRDTGENGEYRLTVLSDKSWSLTLRDNDDWSWLVESTLGSELQLDSKKHNTLLLVAMDETGYLFVNEKFVGDLDLGDKLMSGEICVGTGMRSDTEVDGEETKFSNFTIWRLP